MQTWIWQRLSLQIPDDWEMLQFSKERAKGNCAFADRYMFRLELNWREFDDWPDFERMLEDYQAKLSKSHGMTGFKSETIGAWHGFHCTGDSGPTSRFGRYFEATSQLIELVFLWENHIDSSCLKDILSSVTLQLPKHDEQLWRAFGMTMHTGEEMFLSECDVQPARTRLIFLDREQRPKRQDMFERLGMTEEWLKCDIDEWLTMQQPKFVPEVKITTKSHAHHRVVMAQGPSPSMNFPRLSKNHSWFSAAAWICPNDGRLYHVSRLQPADMKRTSLFGAGLGCCAAVSEKTKV